MIEEIWKPVIGYVGNYKISNIGNIKNEKGFLLNGSINKGGYRYVKLKSKNNIRKNVSIHKLVAIAFIKNKNDNPIINHKNGIKTDNRVENLEWCTYSENNKHAYDNKLKKPRGKKIYQYSKTGDFIKEWDSSLQIQRDLGFFSSCILACCSGKHKTAYGFIWSEEKFTDNFIPPPKHNRAWKRKRISQYSLEGKFIRNWDSISIAGSTLGIFPSSISSCCLGYKKYPHAGGYMEIFTLKNYRLKNTFKVLYYLSFRHHPCVYVLHGESYQ